MNNINTNKMLIFKYPAHVSFVTDHQQAVIQECTRDVITDFFKLQLDYLLQLDCNIKALKLEIYLVRI
jgi:hypothetical protein